VGHVFLYRTGRYSELTCNIAISKALEPVKDEDRPGPLRQLEQDAPGSLQILSAAQGVVRVDIDRTMPVGIEFNVMLGPPDLLSADAIGKNAERGLKQISIEMFDRLPVASRRETSENFLHQVFDFTAVGNPRAKIIGQRAPQGADVRQASRVRFRPRFIIFHVVEVPQRHPKIHGVARFGSHSPGQDARRSKRLMRGTKKIARRQQIGPVSPQKRCDAMERTAPSCQSDVPDPVQPDIAVSRKSVPTSGTLRVPSDEVSLARRHAPGLSPVI